MSAEDREEPGALSGGTKDPNTQRAKLIPQKAERELIAPQGSQPRRRLTRDCRERAAQEHADTEAHHTRTQQQSPHHQDLSFKKAALNYGIEGNVSHIHRA